MIPTFVPVFSDALPGEPADAALFHVTGFSGQPGQTAVRLDVDGRPSVLVGVGTSDADEGQLRSALTTAAREHRHLPTAVLDLGPLSSAPGRDPSRGRGAGRRSRLAWAVPL